jgi:hypothetical protein
MATEEKVFEEVCKMHAGIADFRHKLLALLPVASGAGIFLLLGEKGQWTVLISYPWASLVR